METFAALLAICAGNSPVTGEFPAQWSVTRSFDVSLICAWINGWVNYGEAGDLRYHRTHYDVTVMSLQPVWNRNIPGKLGQYNCCWCPDFLCRKVISNRGVDARSWLFRIKGSCRPAWISRGERDCFGMLPASSCPSISHRFCFIGPGWITLLAPSIRHVIFGYARKVAARVPNIRWKYNFDNIFKSCLNQRKQYTTKRKGGTALSLVHVTSFWC